MDANNKVFLIDDDKIALRAMAKLFRDMNIELSCFSDPVKGLEAISEEMPALVFIDYIMPEMNGDEVIIKISEKKLFKFTSLYLVSGNTFNHEELMKLKTLGFYDIISKPLTKSVVSQVVKNHIGQVFSDPAA